MEGEVKVTDIGSGRKVFRSTFSVPRNGRTVVTSLPKPSGKGIYLIEYEINGEKLKNHYLYGEPTFDISRYKALMKKAGLYGF